MMKNNVYYTMQEILNICDDIGDGAPIYPHNSSNNKVWFSQWKGANVFSIDISPAGAFTENDVLAIIDVLMNEVYNRHSSDYMYMKEINEGDSIELSNNDFLPAMKNVLNILELTLPKYLPMFIQTSTHATNPLAQASSTTSGTNKFNDTPQNTGGYLDDTHATNVNVSTSTTNFDTGSVVARLSELYQNFKSVILDWSNEFSRAFLKEEQLR